MGFFRPMHPKYPDLGSKGWLVKMRSFVVFHRLKAPLCPTYPDWGRSVPVSDLNSLRWQEAPQRIQANNTQAAKGD